ncbi:hypothetical protein SAMN05877809_104225 [Rhodobacter sp. JA431]|uniref:hypothetical protein n=1 Tax=Rhodobacter sp. JA431 TaxID=570013 RepID=UPI000BD15A39|nr:hypothetical protein [Rhodobacter sp. JA431]SOC08069.1 hypothetical protein SAMN05877809_104225 [Rhodobacter sp. JA431]
MTISTRKITYIGAAVALAMLVPVTVAFSSIDPDEVTGPAEPQAWASSNADWGRPMDDHGADIAYGDLSVFDAISEIGADQSPNVPYCDRHGRLGETLAHDFGEHPRVQRPLSNNRSVALWASDVMGTWTAVYTRADGVACVVSSGIGWESGGNPIALLGSAGLLSNG